MDITEERTGSGLVITVQAPRIDAAVAIAFKDQVRKLTEDTDGRVILNLEAVSFIDSSGLGAIVGAMKQLAPARKLELAALNPGVEKVFHLTRMDSVFRIHPTLAAARDALQAAS